MTIILIILVLAVVGGAVYYFATQKKERDPSRYAFLTISYVIHLDKFSVLDSELVEHDEGYSHSMFITINYICNTGNML